MERTLILLKPDCVERRLMGRVISRFEEKGLNIIGMKRLGFSREGIQNLRHAYRLLFSDEGTLVERLADIENDEVARNPQVREILDFIKAHTDRALCMPRSG